MDRLDLKFIAEKRAEYAKSWGMGNAATFEKANDYKWMAEFVSGKNRVFEVGCGVGNSTLELAKRGHHIVSIDENPACLKTAEKRLKTAGIKTHIITRGNIRLLSDLEYKISYRPIPKNIDVSHQVLLIESDIFNDNNLRSWLKRQPSFDAAVCWLIGSNGAKGFNTETHLTKIKTPMHYRVLTQNNVYEWADDILAIGGILHIVDRTLDYVDWEPVKRDLIKHHKEQASVTSLIVSEDIQVRSYSQPENGYDVGMVSASPSDVNPEIKAQKGDMLVSVTSTKP